MALDKFSVENLGGGMGRLVFLNRETGKYESSPLEREMPISKAERRAEVCNKSWVLKYDDL